MSKNIWGKKKQQKPSEEDNARPYKLLNTASACIYNQIPEQ